MKTPDWWQNERDSRALALVPFSYLYRCGAKLRAVTARAYRCPVPVVCVGNACAGGAGKTPSVLYLSDLLRRRGFHTALVSRGYGGTMKGPLRVDPEIHTAADVGDEPLLSAARTPVYIGRSRPAALEAACSADPDVILADDGMQNPTFVKDVIFAVENPEYPPCSSLLFPAGPWRMPQDEARAVAHARLLIYYRADPPSDALPLEAGKPVFRLRFLPDASGLDPAFPYIAFAGTGKPRKFFDTLKAAGIVPAEEIFFPDHHPYAEADERRLLAMAEAREAILITTEKDYVRLSPFLRLRARFLPGGLAAAPAEEERLGAFLERSLRRG